jgi:hypothetical protein
MAPLKSPACGSGSFHCYSGRPSARARDCGERSSSAFEQAIRPFVSAPLLVPSAPTR